MPTLVWNPAPTVDDHLTVHAIGVSKLALEETAKWAGHPVTTLLGAGAKAALEAAGFKGKDGDTYVATKVDGDRVSYVAVIGIGDGLAEEGITRRFAYRATKIAIERGAAKLVVDVRDAEGMKDRPEHGEALAEGALLGAYRYDRFFKEKKPSKLVLVEIAGPQTQAATGLASGRVLAESMSFARDLVNGPAGLVTPTFLADEVNAQIEALKREGHDVSITILEADECQKRGMGAFLGVAQGSDEPPKFIHVSYKPKAPAKGKVALVGKAVTFDSGGYSLKPSDAMYGMKMDMHGSATAFASFVAAVRLGVEFELHAIAAACENLVSGKAYKLGDVLVAGDGTSIEINNTDAEGRLTLADALLYAGALKPDCIIDFATLTGACIVALGPQIAGVMTRDDALATRWLHAAAQIGEGMWRLPLPESLFYMLESKIADMKNTGERWGGALTAGLFLEKFAKDQRWMHVDIAGPAMCERPFDVHVEGGTGFGVLTAIGFLRAGGPN
jgi:leucyl aminopeptidase